MAFGLGTLIEIVVVCPASTRVFVDIIDIMLTGADGELQDITSNKRWIEKNVFRTVFIGILKSTVNQVQTKKPFSKANQVCALLILNGDLNMFFHG